MLGKAVGSFLAGILVVVVALQVSGVNANGKNHPLTSPVTSPITSPSTCKPGWGFGDKNHCHSGPPGLVDKDNDHHTATITATVTPPITHHEDNDDQGENHNNNQQNNGHHH